MGLSPVPPTASPAPPAASHRHLNGRRIADPDGYVPGEAVPGGETSTGEDAEGAAETWQGPLVGTFQAGPDCTPGTYDGEITHSVDADGVVEGEGSTTSSEYTCTFPEGSTTIPEGRAAYAIAGTTDADGFDLLFSDGVGMHLEVSGTTATGMLDTSAGDNYTSVSTIELECVTC